MAEINFYFIHLNPCLIKFSKEKSRIIKEIFENYKEKIDKSATLGEVRLFSFSPKNNDAYSEILECYMPFMKDPCVLICYSVFDIAPTNRVAYGRVSYALLSDKIKTLYFYNYDPVNDVRTYHDTMFKLFKYTSNPYETPGTNERKPQSALNNDELIRDIMKLRMCSPPVKYEDLARVSGLKDSTLRKIGRYYENSNIRGVDITEKQEAYILDLIKRRNTRNFKKFNTIEETFHPWRQEK